mgnify:CR=1 FL=1
MFSFRRLLNFVNKLCCNYHEYQTQKVIFFSAVVFSSVMPKTYPLVGMLNGQRSSSIIRIFGVSEWPLFELSSACSDNRGCTVSTSTWNVTLI